MSFGRTARSTRCLEACFGHAALHGPDGTEQYIRLYGRESGSRVLYFSAQASPAGAGPEEQLISFLCTQTENGGCGRVYPVRPERCAEELFEIDLY